MKTKEFLSLLKSNPGKSLIFEYGQNQLVPASYHITEVKNVSVDSVDCGGYGHQFQEMIVQLWVSKDEPILEYLSTEKAQKIFDIVAKKRPHFEDAEISFEYGFEALRTSVYKVQNVIEASDSLTIQLHAASPQCKPKLLQLETVENGAEKNSSGCNPGSGCC